MVYGVARQPPVTFEWGKGGRGRVFANTDPVPFRSHLPSIHSREANKAWMGRKVRIRVEDSRLGIGGLPLGCGRGC